jgi:hypothetical protein
MMKRLFLFLFLMMAACPAFAQVSPQTNSKFMATPSSGTGYLGLRAITPLDFNNGTGASGTTCLSGILTWVTCIGGPSTTTVGDIAVWNNTAGTLLKDVAVLPSANGGLGAASLSGLIIGNGPSAATAITPGSGVATALAQPVTGTGGIVLSSGADITSLVSGGNFSNWTSYTGNQDLYRFAINGFPASEEFGGGTVPISTGLMVGLLQPSNATGTGNADLAIAGYSQTNSLSQGTQALVGIGATNVSGSGSSTFSTWGSGCVVTNTPSQPSGPNTGNTNGNLYCTEGDTQLRNTPGGGTPNVATRGYYNQGAFDVASSNIMNGFELSTAGAVPWKNGYVADPGSFSVAAFIVSSGADGGSNVGLSLGADGVSGTAGSYTIQFNSLLSGVQKQASIGIDGGGDLVLSPQTGGLVVVTGVVNMKSTSSWGPVTGCGSLTSSTKCLIVTDPNGNSMQIPAYGTY